MPESEVPPWLTSHICVGLSQKTGTWPEIPFLGLSKSVHSSNNLVSAGKRTQLGKCRLLFILQILYSLQLTRRRYLGNAKSAVDDRYVIQWNAQNHISYEASPGFIILHEFMARFS